MEITELNRYWQIFLDEYYHKKPHDGIKEYYKSKGITVPEKGITPDYEVLLPDELKAKSSSDLTYEEDVQLKSAVQFIKEGDIK